ncbi:MAG: uracil-DNA glycosylase [Chloroflexi bacterium]|nr:uracil-DNA glycosylase [Chloroflexota bacterium]
MTQQHALDELHQAMLPCTRCGLAQGRTQVVPGVGPADARIMFIGEGPGFQEDRQGLPFVGPAGQFLNELLASIGLKRDQVYITNVIKCRPPQNRDPMPGEIAACRPWLEQQIARIKPKIIVTLGRHSMARYFPGESISRIHGKHKVVDGTTIFAMYHPAAALHQDSLKATLREDIKKLPALLAQMEAAERQGPQTSPAEAASPPAQQQPHQLSLF